MKPKYIIAVSAEEQSGKSCTINNVWDFLPCYSSSEKINLAENRRHEIWGYVKPDQTSKIIERDSIIGVASRGDKPEQIEEWVVPLMTTYQCDIIVCACHNDDDTLKMVIDLSQKYGYILITYGQFCNYFANREALKRKFANNESSIVMAGDVNLSRFSAMSIVNLIEQLIK